MFEKFVQELAFYEYMRSDCQRLNDPISADYWDAKYHGLSRGIEIATGHYPCAICHGESVEVHIGDYQAVKYLVNPQSAHPMRWADMTANTRGGNDD